MDKERFSLLLLEPNEIYFEDFAVSMVKLDDRGEPTLDDMSNNAWTGRLKMCSKSIVYDPRHIAEPIVKLAYKDCESIYQLPESFHKNYTNVLAVRCTQYTEMMRDNKLAPYDFVAKRSLFLFHFHYGKVENYLNQLGQLKRAASLHAVEQNDMIATIVFSRHNRMRFDPLWLEDPNELVVVDYPVEEINPLVTNPGRLLLSNKRIYFQPYNNIQKEPVKQIKLTAITALTKRRFLLRHISLEIKWTNPLGDLVEQDLLYVAFRNTTDRDSFYDRATKQEDLNATQTLPESMALKWQNSVISNYEYLLYLNSLADRTFQDLTQYPVFPWVINDYTSTKLNLSDPAVYRDLTKPVGALNAERLARLKERCEEMGEPRFLYGSHYSAPGLVLFYLVRKFPNLMLCLQNGRFDHPDRMFNRIQDAFQNCQRNMSDFKELTPEFYNTELKGDFLRNTQKIYFGCRHDGVPVNHVALPPWANDSPEVFVTKMREALESDYVSQDLHHWIDLIFGYKQRGKEAEKANNLFYHLCYEGAVDLGQIKELTARHALEVQISEFGQIPKQLFDRPHVARTTAADLESRQQRSSGAETALVTVVPFRIDGLQVQGIAHSHRDLILCVLTNGDQVMSTGKDGLLKCYNILDRKQYSIVAIGSLPLSSCVLLPKSNTVVLGSWDNSITTYDLDYGRTLRSMPAHDDAVSCLSIVSGTGILVSGSWDCSVKIWKGFATDEILTSYRFFEALLHYWQFGDKVSSVQAIVSTPTATTGQQHLLVAVGTFAGDVHLWRMRMLRDSPAVKLETDVVRILHTHTDEVTATAFDVSGRQVASCGLDRVLLVTDVETGMTLFRKEHAEALCCLDWRISSGEYLVLGDESGALHVWNMQSGTMETHCQSFDGVISAVATTRTTDGRTRIVVAGVDGREFSVKIVNCV